MKKFLSLAIVTVLLTPILAFANQVPVLYCLQFPTLGTLNQMMQTIIGSGFPSTTIQVQGGNLCGSYVLFWGVPLNEQTTANFMIENNAPTAKFCPQTVPPHLPQ